MEEDITAFKKILQPVIIDNALIIGNFTRQTKELKAAFSQYRQNLTAMPQTTEFTKMALNRRCQLLESQMEPVFHDIDLLQETLHKNNIRLILAAAMLKDESSDA